MITRRVQIRRWRMGNRSSSDGAQLQRSAVLRRAASVLSLLTESTILRLRIERSSNLQFDGAHHRRVADFDERRAGGRRDRVCTHTHSDTSQQRRQRTSRIECIRVAVSLISLWFVVRCVSSPGAMTVGRTAVRERPSGLHGQSRQRAAQSK